MDIAVWLRGLGLEEYGPAFAENHIRPELLPELTSDDLKELGVASVAGSMADADGREYRPQGNPEEVRVQ
jgi:hypothetical protein